MLIFLGMLAVIALCSIADSSNKVQIIVSAICFIAILTAMTVIYVRC